MNPDCLVEAWEEALRVDHGNTRLMVEGVDLRSLTKDPMKASSGYYAKPFHLEMVAFLGFDEWYSVDVLVRSMMRIDGWVRGMLMREMKWRAVVVVAAAASS